MITLKKILCFLFGHKLELRECPDPDDWTEDIEYLQCVRCNYKEME